MKKLIGIVPVDQESADLVVSSMMSMGAVKGVLSPLDPIHEHLVPVLKTDLDSFKKNIPFGTNYEIREHHLRNFCSKLSRGVKPVSDFLGKQIKSPKEATEYFVNTVGKKWFGEDWLLDVLLEKLSDASDGVYLATNLSLEQAEALKTKLGNDFVSVLVTNDNSPSIETDKAPFSENKTELHLSLHSKATAKRLTLQTLEKLKEKWKEVNNESKR